MPIELAQIRVREILAIPPETMRHWRKVFPSLAERRRHSKFSPGDLVALAVIRELVRVAGINSSAVAPYASGLFAICNSQPWHALAQTRIQIQAQAARAAPAKSPAPVVNGPVIIVQLGPIIDELVRLLGMRSAAQIEFNFPLSAVSGRRS